ncbi:unnamed protein product [marine sediment metagenome]|uniref:Swt1-like HEPN domain-containing protein n=1 Tax=marine sediment metagenome TaxID=412755 RepID=X1QJ42_9ZZZZ
MYNSFKLRWLWVRCKSIKDPAKKRKDEELKIKWHTQRGTDLINYTTMSNLANIMRNNWEHFEPFVQSIEWATNIFDAVERSRNVIMHSGVLERGGYRKIGDFSSGLGEAGWYLTRRKK